MIYNIKENSIITFDYENQDYQQGKTTYIVLVDFVKVGFNRLGELQVEVTEKANYVLDSEDGEIIGFINYEDSTLLNDTCISNLHVSTSDEVKKFKEALKEDGTFEVFFKE